MPVPTIIRGEVWEDSGAILMARIKSGANANLQQADLTGIAYSIYDLSSPSTAAVTGTLTVGSVIFDTLQVPDVWTFDTTGYNFRWDAAASIFIVGGHVYRFEIMFDPVSGEDFPIVFELEAKKLKRS